MMPNALEVSGVPGYLDAGWLGVDVGVVDGWV